MDLGGGDGELMGSSKSLLWAYNIEPLSKPFMSSKSLEMCTESLGTETGSGIDQFCHLDLDLDINCRPIHYETKHQKPTNKGNGPTPTPKKGFPPPLTSISGVHVQVHTHREGGRLLMKASFAFESSRSFFTADRRNGRLRLSLLRDRDPFCGDKEAAGKLWSNSTARCNGTRSTTTNKRMQSFHFCVVGV